MLGSSKIIEPCKHHWHIELGKDVTSEGICQFCGTKRSFLNILPASVEREMLLRQYGKSMEFQGSKL